MVDWTKITGFDWDEGNSRKNQKHGVSMAESEQVFFNLPLLKPCFHALGKADDGRQLHITFTVRHHAEKIRIISARDMHRKERTVYEKAT